MNIWMSETVVRGVGWTLVHFVWEGMAIGGVLMVTLRLMRRTAAHWRYLAACAAMALMAVTPLATFQLVLEKDEPSVITTVAVTDSQMPTAEPPLLPSSISEPQVVTVPAQLPAPVGLPQSPAGNDVRSVKHFPFSGDQQSETPHVVSHLYDGLLVQRLEPCMPWFVTAWLAGVFILSARLLAGWWQIRRLKRRATVSPGEILEQKLADLAQRLGIRRAIRLLQSALIEVPTVVGWLRPVILLPASCLTGLTPQQLEAILVHELAHIRRHDYLINLLQSAIETLLFYHPAVWWVSRKMREERENCCDDLAVVVSGDRVGYARALATLEELRPAPAQLALGASGAPLLQRIRRLAGRSETPAASSGWPLSALLLVLVLALVLITFRQHRASAAEANPGSAEKASSPMKPNIEPSVQPVESPKVADTSQNETVATNQSQPSVTPAPSTGQAVIQDWHLEALDNRARTASNDLASLQTRTFRVDPVRFLGALGANLGVNPGSAPVAKVTAGSGGGGFGGGGNSDGSIPFVTAPHEAPAHENIENAIRDYFKGSGIELSTNSGKVVIYNVSGELTVSATGPELDTIAAAVDSLNQSPPEVNVRVKFVEFDLANAAWVDSLLAGIPKFINPPSKVSGGPTSLPAADSMTNPATISGILTEPQFRSILGALEQRRGTEVLTTPEVTTENGRQAQMQAVDIQQIVTGPATNAGGYPSTTALSFGPEIDVVPYIDGPRSNISLAIIPSVTEFVGYDNPGEFTTQAKVHSGNTTASVLPLPHFRLRQTVTSVMVRDGQTAAITGFAAKEVSATSTSKTPLLGDIPLLGRLFRGRHVTASKKGLIVFVTATIVNPDGTRYHSAEKSGQSTATSASQPAKESNGQQGVAGSSSEVAALVQHGKSMFEARHYDDAEADFKKALGLDRNNLPAEHYLELIQEKRPVNPYSHQTNVVNTSPGRKEIFDKLNSIRIEEVNYPDLPLKDVVDDLAVKAKSGDPEGKGINFFFSREMTPATNEADVESVKVQILLKDVTLAQVLDALLKTSDRPIKYSVLDYGIMWSLRGPETVPLEIRNFKLVTNALENGLFGVTPQMLARSREVDEAWHIPRVSVAGQTRVIPFVTADPNPVAEQIRAHFTGLGIDLSTNSGKALIWNSRWGMLTVKATAEDIDLIEKIIQAASAVSNNPPAAQPPPAPASSPATNSSRQSPGRKIIYDKLNRIPIESLNYNDLPLKDVLDDLSAKALARDPDGKGIDFFFSHDPSSNQPDIGAVKVQFSLKHITLAQALDAIRMSSDRPIKFSVLDYGVMFSLRGNEPETLEIRTFKVDAGVFKDRMTGGVSSQGFSGSSSGITQSNLDAGTIERQARAFFSAVGIDLSTNSGKAVIWDDQKGRLVVRATHEDLDIIEKALQISDRPKVQLKVRFAEIALNDKKAFGFQWDLGGMAVGRGGATVLNGGTAPSLAPAPTNVNPLGFFPGTASPPPGPNTLRGTAIAPAGSFAGNSMAQPTNAPAIATTTGILTDAQYRMVLQALEQRDGTEVLTAPEAAVESGRQAQFQGVDISEIVAVDGSSLTNMVSAGPELDVVPYVADDGKSIQMALIPSVTDFVGYDNPGQFVPQAAIPAGGTITGVLPLPHFRLRQIVTSVTVLDGQTVAFGGLISPGKTLAQVKAETEAWLQKNPGHVAPDEAHLKAMTVKKTLLVFVTATLVNPDGTPFHTQAERDALGAKPGK